MTSGVSSSVPDWRPIADHRHDQPVAGKVAAVAEHLVADLAAAGAVDQDAARRHLARQPPAVIVEPDEVAVFRQQHLGTPSRPARQSGRAAPAAGTPHVSARSSFGLTSESMSLSSSSLPWPETWTCLSPSEMTSASRRAMWFITRPIAFSLPGISRAEKTTTSSGSSLTWRWSSIAIRGSAACGSPCEPVQMQTTSWAGKLAHVAVANLDPGRNPQVAEPLRDLGVLDHAAADERHPAVELRRQVHEDLHPVDARREHRHDDLAGGAR